MSVDNKVPEIRFKGFSGEWKTSELSGLALFNPKAELPENFKYVDLESVKGTSLIGYKIESIDTAPSRAQRLAQKGDVFYQTVRPYQKNNYLFHSVEVDYVFSTGYAQLRPYFNSNFLLNLVQRDSFVKDVLNNCTGTSYPAINASTLATLGVSYPKSEAEQTRIGNYFQKLDALINQHQQKHDKLSSIKKAMLEKMFPKHSETMPEIRFKGFSGEWEENVLSNEVEFFNGLTYSLGDIRKSGTLVLRSSNVKNGQLIDADDVYVNPEVVNCSNVIEGDIIVVVRNGSRNLIGKHAQVTTRMNNTVIGAFMTGIRSKQPAFINALLDTKMFTDEVERNLGATINQITNGSFKNMIFMFPKKDEQQKIGTYFQKLDALINQHRQQITKLNNTKQACLSKMFV